MHQRKVGERFAKKSQWEDSGHFKSQHYIHINVLELQAVKLALMTFAKKFDNMTALSYLLKIGGTQSQEMIGILKEIWEFATMQRS